MPANDYDPRYAGRSSQDLFDSRAGSKSSETKTETETSTPAGFGILSQSARDGLDRHRSINRIVRAESLARQASYAYEDSRGRASAILLNSALSYLAELAMSAQVPVPPEIPVDPADNSGYFDGVWMGVPPHQSNTPAIDGLIEKIRERASSSDKSGK